MADRSLLRVSMRPHAAANREKGEFIVEVWRQGEVVATIFGSQEGVHIVSQRLGGRNQPVPIDVSGIASVLIPLLAPDEACPWCHGTGVAFGAGAPCMICARAEEKT